MRRQCANTAEKRLDRDRFIRPKEAIRRQGVGAVDDDLAVVCLPESVVAARCYVAQADGAVWPDRARKFLNDYFLDLGRLRAAGDWVDPDGTFSIAVPGQYIVLDDKGGAKLQDILAAVKSSG